MIKADRFVSRTKPDYSASFTREVADIAIKLRVSTKLDVRHNTDMNYRSSQSLHMCFDEAMEAADCGTATSRYEMIIFISSVAEYYTIRWLRRENKNVWAPVDEKRLPKLPSKIDEQISTTMTQRGYSIITGAVLDELVEDRVTELDQAPATLFQVLFAELY